MAEPNNETLAVPNLYVVTVKQPFCTGDGLAIVTTNHLLKSYEVIVVPNEISPAFLHGTHSRGRSSPLRSLAISGDRKGSPPSQSMQRNLRPPVLTSMNFIGLRHLGQDGGGAFFGM
jgi:hypothetical protein